MSTHDKFIYGTMAVCLLMIPVLVVTEVITRPKKWNIEIDWRDGYKSYIETMEKLK